MADGPGGVPDNLEAPPDASVDEATWEAWGPAGRYWYKSRWAWTDTCRQVAAQRDEAEAALVASREEVRRVTDAAEVIVVEARRLARLVYAEPTRHLDRTIGAALAVLRPDEPMEAMREWCWELDGIFHCTLVPHHEGDHANASVHPAHHWPASLRSPESPSPKEAS